MSEKKRVLMICLGNICRSPIAEAVFADYIKINNLGDKWEVDSAALIGYHLGKQPDRRALATLAENGITDYKHKVRKVEAKDFNDFDWIFGMDEDNMEELERIKPDNCRATVELLGEHDPQGEKIIRDPYYDSDSNGFKKVYEQCVRCVAAFVKKN